VKNRLFYPLFLSIGLRYAWSSGNHRFASFIALLSMLGIMLGVAALIVVISVMNGLEGTLKDRILSVVPHAVVTQKDEVIDKNYPINEITENPLVLNIMPQVSAEVIVQGPSEVAGVNIYGIDPAQYPKYDLIRSSVGSKVFNKLEPRSYEVIIGEALSQKLGVGEGEKLRIIVPSNIRYTPMGRVPVSRLLTVSHVYSIGVGDVESTTILANIEDVRKLAGIQKNKISGFRVWLTEPYAIGEFISKTKAKDDSLVINDWRIQKGDFFRSVAMEKLMMSIMLALIILVAVFNMLSALVMVVTSKISEIAIMRTMGISSTKIMLIFVVEGALSGLLGSIFGTILGLLAVKNIDALLSVLGLNFYLVAGGSSLPYQIEYPQIFLIVLGTIILSFMITIYPSLRAARMNPAASLRYE
jgi:lipoprotein-releasing system permease protein